MWLQTAIVGLVIDVSNHSELVGARQLTNPLIFSVGLVATPALQSALQQARYEPGFFAKLRGPAALSAAFDGGGVIK